MKKRKVFSICLAFSLIFTVTIKVFADPSLQDLQNQKANLENQANDNKNKAGNLQSKIDNMESQIETLDNQIQQMMRDIDLNNIQIDKVKGQIVQTQGQIDQAEANIKKEQDLFNKRMKVMYEDGNESYLEIIFDSKGISDMIDRVEAVKRVADYDKKMLADLNEKRNDIVVQKNKLDAENTSLQKLKQDNENKLAALSETKASQSKLVENYKKQQGTLTAENAQYQKEITSLVSKINSWQAPAPTPGAPVSNNAVIQYAMKFLGCEYVWGARGPTTFDCSGFVQYVYRHFGYEVGYTTYDQRDYGKLVDKSDLQPGDMIFFGPSYEGIHHVALYVGDGYYIHAPHTGDVVKISRLSDASDYYFARRVIY